MAKVRVNWGPAPEGCSVNLFDVINTSSNRLLVLARDGQTAMRVAHTANHVYDPKVTMATYYSRRAEKAVRPFPRSPHFENLIQIAMARRLEGTVHCDGDKLFVGEQLITLE